MELNTYETLVVHQNGVSGDGEFSLDSFKFVDTSASVELYIHCSIMLCDPRNSIVTNIYSGPSTSVYGLYSHLNIFATSYEYYNM